MRGPGPDVPEGRCSLFVSYDGALDPLGRSQVLPYVVGLARQGVSMSLITFEKPVTDRAELETLRGTLTAEGVRWIPLAYHRKPRLPATAFDLARGAAAITRELRRARPQLVHCRGDVAMAMARVATPRGRPALLYDPRGLFSDERVESGSWQRGSLTDRIVRRIESGNLERAAALVVLTERAAQVLAQRRPRLPPLRVIPTCVDLVSFSPPGTEGERPYALVYSGSLGTWYMAAEMVAFARRAAAALGGRALFLTPQPEVADSAGARSEWADVRTASPKDVPAWLRQARALFFFIRPTPAKAASCPTKLAEGLACGLPVVANAGVGDLDSFLEAEGVGVLVRGFGEDDYAAALARLQELLADPATPGRCRALAEARFGLASAVGRYLELYRILGDGHAA